MPKARTIVTKDSVVILYTDDNSTRTSVTVPDLKGMNLAKAKSTLKEKNLNINFSGNGLVISQDIKADDTVEEGSIITVKLAY